MSPLHQLAVEPGPVGIAKSGPTAGTREFAPRSCCPFRGSTAGSHFLRLLGWLHFENFPNIFCRPPLLPAGVFTYLARLSLNFIFTLQIEPFVPYNAPQPPHKSFKWSHQSLVDHFLSRVHYFVGWGTWFLGC